MFAWVSLQESIMTKSENNANAINTFFIFSIIL